MAKGAEESAEKLVKDIRRKTRREATSDEVSALRKENARLKEVVSELLYIPNASNLLEVGTIDARP